MDCSWNREEIFEEIKEEFSLWMENLSQKKTLNLDSLEPNKTTLFIIDMNNGFAKEGALYSKNVEDLIDPIAKLTKRAIEKKIKTFAYTDFHDVNSIELQNYPSHCIGGTKESEIVEELKDLGLTVLNKNSTNGFMAINPFEKFEELKEKDTFIIVGDCTDICIYQFAVTLKTYFNEKNKKVRVIVPIKLVDTFDGKGHNANIMNIVFLNSMESNGIEVVEDIH